MLLFKELKGNIRQFPTWQPIAPRHTAQPIPLRSVWQKIYTQVNKGRSKPKEQYIPGSQANLIDCGQSRAGLNLTAAAAHVPKIQSRAETRSSLPAAMLLRAGAILTPAALSHHRLSHTVTHVGGGGVYPDTSGALNFQGPVPRKRNRSLRRRRHRRRRGKQAVIPSMGNPGFCASNCI
ncbi:hypothetical protein SKAU_G00084720 [Synaphobranchus kaupii]|uniref:Uncharacterized protein n=1 Tax=Synaphobranchus kaupii TaxID=118154 RepID=A0A9Q1FW07_SYNKA|nr:hypothetical protein SKAU_G00084720 [Synaphobranchus kaupii]